VHLLFCLPVVLWLLHDDPRRFGQRADGEPRAAPAVREVDTAEALRTPSLYLLALVYAASGMAVFGVLVNSAQVLTQGAGLSMANIASAQAVAGASVLLGRVLVGYLLDRFPARLLGAIVTLVTAAAVLGYANATTPAFALLSAMLLGFGIGGETDVMPYMAARYFGTRSLGTLLGLLGAAFTLGAAISPLAFSWMASASGTVTLPLYVFASITAISALAFWAMPPLPAPAPGSLAA
jgi:OFA family oxalate/formate antiporter-like MFS transporter